MSALPPQQKRFEDFINECSFPVKDALKQWWADFYDEGFNFSEIQSWEAVFPSEKGSDIPIISVSIKMRDKTFSRDFYLTDLAVFKLI